MPDRGCPGYRRENYARSPMDQSASVFFLSYTLISDLRNRSDLRIPLPFWQGRLFRAALPAYHGDKICCLRDIQFHCDPGRQGWRSIKRCLVPDTLCEFYGSGDRVFVPKNLQQLAPENRGLIFFKTFFSGGLINTFALGFKNLEISPE
jgi:hypothetical protein